MIMWRIREEQAARLAIAALESDDPGILDNYLRTLGAHDLQTMEMVGDLLAERAGMIREERR